MHLEKLAIQGFKSFANKNELIFPNPKEGKKGLTAIVGPNGSGKSNIADAVRWALGEQSMKALRGKKSEDIIFSGSDKKGKLGMAEVSLFLNNEDRKVAIDYSEIVLTRRLYRNGDSEYLVNNSRSRLGDIQMMLAKASFGQKTYGVIGQGTVEGFLNTSLTERKEFFDEATGVKQYQIKRDDALNKLKLSHENLGQAKLLLDEIDPRLKSLTKQVKRLERRGELETELRGLECKYYAKIWHQINDSFNMINKEFLELEQSKLKKTEKLEIFAREHSREEARRGDFEEYEAAQRELSALQSKRDNILRELASAAAKIEIKLEANGKFDLSWMARKTAELKNELQAIKAGLESLGKSLESGNAELAELRKERASIEEEAKALSEKMLKASAQFDSREAEKITARLEKSLEKLADCEREENIGRIREILKEIREELEELALMAGNFAGRDNLKKMQADLFALAEKKEKISARENEKLFAQRSDEDRKKFFASQRDKLRLELGGLERKISEQRGMRDSDALDKEKKRLEKELESSGNEISLLKENIESSAREKEEKRRSLFELQRNIRSLQEESDKLASQLNEKKVAAARYETRLEDLEADIRENGADIKAIRAQAPDNGLDEGAASQRIHQIKKQLEQIGGIDPEIEKEYAETKDRFDFLSTQSSDLISAVGSLEKIIKELDMTIKEQFDHEFKIIEKKFEEYFKILFNGGRAKLLKVMEKELEEEAADATAGADMEDTGEKSGRRDKEEPAGNGPGLKKIKFLQKHNATGLAGVEIHATPPGKKIMSISMLSGGERALTAIALICAIISANPSPFVVLDEVDAALDEANSERLAKILDDLSGKTQFIVITHNRASMRRANILYGVSMQDDGASRLLSIKLEEAGKFEEKK
jgi:chromosome segregation protein